MYTHSNTADGHGHSSKSTLHSQSTQTNFRASLGNTKGTKKY
uniref:Uncharacterized protein n=1 Tax=Anguilla anguilla TaxID=7936 RepID=A0A0E9VTP8_ANGAN